MQFKKHLLIFILMHSIMFHLHSQNIEKIGGPVLTMSGNITVGSSFYKAIDRENRRSPFAYFVSANTTFTIFGFDLPVNFSYRGQQGSISNPFNRLSFNPRYKWAKLNLGKFTKRLSTYTLAGQVITGAALDLTPGKFRFSIVSGNMENPLIQIDTILNIAEALPSYKRKALGAKIGFGSSTNFIDLIAFTAKDDFNSIDQSLNNLQENRPQENAVISTSFGLRPLKWVSFKAEVSASAHTSNQQAGDYIITDDVLELRENYGSQLALNHSTKLQFAGNAKIDFKFKKFGFGAEYERVDPLYKSLGAFYFQEDYENLLFKMNFNLLNGKLRMNNRVGIQRNNLTNLRKVTNTRTILNASLSIVPSKDLVVVARYTNFQTDRSPGLIALNDSLRFANTTAAYGLSPRFMFGSEDKRSTISIGFNHQSLTDVLADEGTGNNIENNVLSIGYNLNLRPSGTNINLSLLGNRNIIKEIERDRIGANLGLSKALSEDKLVINLGLGGFQNYLDGEVEGYSITGRLGARYKLKKSLNIITSVNFINRTGDNGYSEIRGNIRFSYRLPKVSSSKNKTNNLQNPQK